MHPDLDDIVAADAVAGRDVARATQRLADREQAERGRLKDTQDAAAAAARSKLDADLLAVESEGGAAVESRRRARAALRERRRELAVRATASAVADYVRIVRGETAPEDKS
jgi:hypothetical protein